MLLERAELLIREGSEEDFARVLESEAGPLLASQPGVLSVQFGRGVENPGKFMLLVEWESMEAHVAFQQGPTAPPFRRLLTPYSVGGSMEHFEFN